MQNISLKSNSPETIIPLLKNAIEREKCIHMETLMIANDKVKKLAENLDVDVEKLMNGQVKHTNDNDMQLIELEGEIEIIRRLESELEELEAVEICG